MELPIDIDDLIASEYKGRFCIVWIFLIKSLLLVHVIITSNFLVMKNELRKNVAQSISPSYSRVVCVFFFNSICAISCNTSLTPLFESPLLNRKANFIHTIYINFSLIKIKVLIEFLLNGVDWL